MKSAYLLSVTAIFLTIMVSAVSGDLPEPENQKFVEITTHFPSVYRNLKPHSEVITQPKRGDRLELVSEGKRWYRVRVGDETGFLETRAGIIISEDSTSKSGLFLILGLLIIGGLAGGGVFYFRKQESTAP
ncbi:hypothetical protein CHISP_1420 [Chitinispirillum alkaliphilum]|nr:hypothetical protein CHISP_1420 [Chitinispirillum alkaliphilum]